jgi:hypothetical protein
MRTTVDINDALLKRIKVLLAKRQTSMRSLIEEGLQRILDDDRSEGKFELEDQSIDGDGLAPGISSLAWDEIRPLIYNDKS